MVSILFSLYIIYTPTDQLYGASISCFQCAWESKESSMYRLRRSAPEKPG